MLASGGAESQENRADALNERLPSGCCQLSVRISPTIEPLSAHRVAAGSSRREVGRGLRPLHTNMQRLLVVAQVTRFSELRQKRRTRIVS